MNQIKVGDKVVDVFTGRTGKVLAVSGDDGSRVTADLGVYTMTGCHSWFDVVVDA